MCGGGSKLKRRQVTTVTPNPAIDKTYWLEGLQPGRQNRVSRVRKSGRKRDQYCPYPQGYGLEVAALGFFGGIMGRELLNMLEKEGVQTAPVFVDEDTRTNTKIMDPTSGAETEINEPGPYVGEREQSLIEQHLADYALQSGYTVFSGSLPQGCPSEFYRRLIATAHQHGCKTILDTSGPALKEGIKAAPYLIKPNHHELSELIGRELRHRPRPWNRGPFGCGISYCRRRRLFGAAGCCDDKFRGGLPRYPAEGQTGKYHWSR